MSALSNYFKNLLVDDTTRRALVAGLIRVVATLTPDRFNRISKSHLAALTAFAEGQVVDREVLEDIAAVSFYEAGEIAKVCIDAHPAFVAEGLLQLVRVRSPQATFGQAPYQGRGDAARRGHMWAVGLYEEQEEVDGLLLGLMQG